MEVAGMTKPDVERWKTPNRPPHGFVTPATRARARARASDFRDVQRPWVGAASNDPGSGLLKVSSVGKKGRPGCAFVTHAPPQPRHRLHGRHRRLPPGILGPLDASEFVLGPLTLC